MSASWIVMEVARRVLSSQSRIVHLHTSSSDAWHVHVSHWQRINHVDGLTYLPHPDLFQEKCSWALKLSYSALNYGIRRYIFQFLVAIDTIRPWMSSENLKGRTMVMTVTQENLAHYSSQQSVFPWRFKIYTNRLTCRIAVKHRSQTCPLQSWQHWARDPPNVES